MLTVTDRQLTGSPDCACLANVHDADDHCLLGVDHVGPCVAPADVRRYRARRLDALVATWRELGEIAVRYVDVADAVHHVLHGEVLLDVAREVHDECQRTRAAESNRRRKLGEWADRYALASLFDQQPDDDAYWLVRSGARVLVRSMSDEHRLNAARLLLMSAAWFAKIYARQTRALAFGAHFDVVDDLERRADAALRNPVLWLRRSSLFRVLVRGLVKKKQRVARDAYRCPASFNLNSTSSCSACGHRACGWCTICEATSINGTLFDDSLALGATDR